MNSLHLYDKKWAADELEKFALARMADKHSHVHIAKLMEETKWPDSYQAYQDGPVARLACATSGTNGAGGEIEEAVLTFQGIVYNIDVAPFKEKPSDKGNQARYIRQSITVGGLGTSSFQKVVGNVAEIHALFSRATGRDELSECSMMGDEGGETVLYASNRYFTPLRDVGKAQRVPLTADIDPHGYLARIGGENYVHTEDNYVHYFERKRAVGAEEHSFVRCQPVKFRVGDIVEVQVSFVVLMLREGKKKSAMVLRSLLLLDGSVTQKCIVDNITKSTAGRVSTATALKRRVGYGEEGEGSGKIFQRGDEKRRIGYENEEVEARRKFSQMEIDGDDKEKSDLD